MKKINKFFLTGCVFGAILLVVTIIFIPPPIGKEPVTFWEQLLNTLFDILYFPGKIVNPLNKFIHSIANITGGNFDKGLGFDGPLAWLEWLSIIIAMALWYGFIFYIIGKFFRKNNS